MNRLIHQTTTIEGTKSAMSRALTAARVREAAAAKALDESDDLNGEYEVWAAARKYLRETEEAARSCPF